MKKRLSSFFLCSLFILKSLGPDLLKGENFSYNPYNQKDSSITLSSSLEKLSPEEQQELLEYLNFSSLSHPTDNLTITGNDQQTEQSDNLQFIALSSPAEAEKSKEPLFFSYELLYPIFYGVFSGGSIGLLVATNSLLPLTTVALYIGAGSVIGGVFFSLLYLGLKSIMKRK